MTDETNRARGAMLDEMGARPRDGAGVGEWVAGELVAGELVAALPARTARRWAARDPALLAIAASRVRVLELLRDRGAPVRWALVEQRLRWRWRLWRDGGRPALQGLARALAVTRTAPLDRWTLLAWWDRSPAACLHTLASLGLLRSGTTDQHVGEVRGSASLPAG